MKNPKVTTSLAGIAALAVLSFSPAAMAAEEGACSDTATKVTAQVKAQPSDVLKVVAEQVAASPKCACEVVKAAIAASKADKDLVVSIVEAAATVAPDELPTVLSCAASSAPEAAAALANHFSDETSGSGKGVVGKESVGKEPMGKGAVEAPKEEEPDYSIDFGMLRPGVGGIYLSTPSGGFVTQTTQTGTNTVIVTRRVTVTRPVGVPTPVTPDSSKD